MLFSLLLTSLTVPCPKTTTQQSNRHTATRPLQNGNQTNVVQTSKIAKKESADISTFRHFENEKRAKKKEPIGLKIIPDTAVFTNKFRGFTKSLWLTKRRADPFSGLADVRLLFRNRDILSTARPVARPFLVAFANMKNAYSHTSAW